MPLTGLEAVLGVTVVALLAYIAYQLHSLDGRGALVGALLGLPIVIGGGWTWLLLVILFFALATRLTRFRYTQKQALGYAQEQQGRRGWGNALANVGVAAVLASAEGWLLYTGGEGRLVTVGFVGAIASATADTVATEVGLLSRQAPRLITHPRHRVTPGRSGGVTTLGSSVMVTAAALIGLAAAVLRFPGAGLAQWVVLALVGGILGALVDSVLGATVQGQYRCERCGQLVDTRRHHGVAAVPVRGWRRVGNDVVNLVGTGTGALGAMLAALVV